MKDRSIRRNLYRVLRKLGIPRSFINENVRLDGDLLLDAWDRDCFLFYVEDTFGLRLSAADARQMSTVGSAISFLGHKLA